MFPPSYPPPCQNPSYNDITRLNESNSLSIHPQSFPHSFLPSLQIPSYNETELSMKLKIEIDSGNKLKTLSRNNQDDITKLSELRKISEAMVVTEKKIIHSTQTISCWKEDIKCIKIPKENFENKLLQQSSEITELTVKLKRETKLVMKLKILSKDNQDEITRLDKCVKSLITNG